MRKKFGLLIWTATVLIISAGLICLYSASYQNVRVSNKVFYDQLIFSIIGLFLIFYLSRIDYRRFYDLAYVFYGISVFFLVLVLFAGRHALGATRWFTIAGVSFQPSELAKLGLILAVARYLSDHPVSGTYRLWSSRYQILWHGLLVPLFISVLPMLLAFKQPDLGTAILFFGIFLILVFASGLPYPFLGGFVGLCLAVMPFGWHILKSYQKDRLLVFLNPNIDPLGAGYTIIQSKIALGSGQLFGKGWLAGTQNQLNFLPERHTDFIFSVIGEEWGLFGTIFLLACYYVFIVYGLQVAEQVKDKFGTYLAVGIIGIIALQAIINIGMVMGLCPVVGITLPMVSYGRSSFMMFIVMIGLLLSLNHRRKVF
jgi:rod shape determining protein RodA